jgi:hypothetical protein
MSTSNPTLPSAGGRAGSPRTRTFLKAANEILTSRGVLDANLVAARCDVGRGSRGREASTVVDAIPWTAGHPPGRVVATLGRFSRTMPSSRRMRAISRAGPHAAFASAGPGRTGPTSGAMGYGLPAAIAAALVQRDRAVGPHGTGSAMTSPSRDGRSGAGASSLVFDNRATARSACGRTSGVGQGVATELGPVDFAAAARAFGAAGAHVSTDAEFEPALRAAAADGPTVIQLALDRAWSRSTDRPADAADHLIPTEPGQQRTGRRSRGPRR